MPQKIKEMMSDHKADVDVECEKYNKGWIVIRKNWIEMSPAVSDIL